MVTRSRLARIALGLLMVPAVLLPAAARAAEPAGPVQIRDVDTSAYPTIGITVALPGTVDPQSLGVRENGVAAEVFNVRPILTAGDEVDIVLAIDTSDSVRGGPLASAVEAAKAFIQILPSGLRVGILTFSDQVRIKLPITADHAAALSTLTGLTNTQKGTKLNDAVVAAAGMFSGPAQHNVVLFTDGSDFGSDSDLATAAGRAKDVGAAVFTVGLEAPNTDFDALRSISTATGGTFSPATSANLQSLFESLAGSLTHQYRIQYRSQGAAGAQVTIAVDAAGGSDEITVLFPRTTVAPSGRHFLFFSGTLGLIVVLVLAFLAVFLFAGLIVGTGQRAKRDRSLAQRMSADSMPQPDGIPARPDERSGTWIPTPLVQAGQAVAKAGGFKGSLDYRLERAGLPLSSGEVVAGSILGALLGFVVGWLISRNVVVTFALGFVGGVLPFVLLSRVMNRRLNRLHAQLPDVLSILASSMRAGHSFLQALDTVAKEVGDPAGPEFARVVAEIRLGRPFEEAMTMLADRVGTEEFKWAILAINVQREVGGNLAEILDILSETVRERDAVRRQVRVLSAEGRMSVKILVAMPFFMALYLSWANPSYMRLLWTTPLGLGMIAVGAVLLMIGAIWSWRMVKIDV